MIAGMALTAVVAYAATNWIVGLNSGSSGQSQAATVSNLTIAASATPAPVGYLFPGGVADVVMTITNPNSMPVTVTGVSLPANTTYAAGYSNSALTSAQTGCSSSASGVYWSFATGSSGSAHTFTTPLVVDSNSTLTVTLDSDATMSATAPAACENTYFSMPSLTAIAATAGSGTGTVSPTTDSWTS